MKQPALCEFLSRSLGEAVITAASGSYEGARRVWNGIIDQYPAAIVSCRDEQDIRTALAACRDHGVPVTVRGGGHNVAGLAVRNGGVVLDLSGMRSVAVHADRRTASVQGGALWSDVDAATALHGRATTGGLVSTTGVGGLTLGGGAGWLMRRHGLACDNVVSARVVLADGQVVRVSPTEHPDLHWLMRGGGGRFGVVTEFEFRLHPVSTVLAGLLIYPGEEAGRVLRGFRDFVGTAPDEFCGMVVIANAPPLPFLAPAWHGRPVTILGACWCGSLPDGVVALKALRGIGQPLADAVHDFPYVQWQQMQDPGAPPGRYQYWKTASFGGLTESTIDLLAAAAHRLPSQTTELHVQHLGGAVERIPDNDSAFAARGAQYFINLIGSVTEPGGFPAMRAWVRETHANLSREALPGTLPNFSGTDDAALEGQFGATRAAKIADLRRRYDPTGLFMTS
jgi:FAD binding domain